MKPFNLFPILTAAILLFFSSCYKHEIDDLWKQTEGFDQRIAALEEWQKQVNTNISSLQKLIEALENADFITGVTPITEGGVVIGYTISFTKSAPITIYHGQDGADGQDGVDGQDGLTPKIGVKQDTDGKYYWTIDKGDGTVNWMLDDEGNKIPTTGDSGQPGIAPMVRIDSITNFWEISTDSGVNWESTGVYATGPAGSTVFRGVTIFQDYVIITLNGGKEIQLPRYKDIMIEFAIPVSYMPGQELIIPYVIPDGSAAPTSIQIINLPPEWKSKVDIAAQEITIIAPDEFRKYNLEGNAVLVLCYNNEPKAMLNLPVAAYNGKAGDIITYKGVEMMVLRERDGDTPGLLAATPQHNNRNFTFNDPGVNFLEFAPYKTMFGGADLFMYMKSTFAESVWKRFSPWMDADELGPEWFIATIADFQNANMYNYIIQYPTSATVGISVITFYSGYVSIGCVLPGQDYTATIREEFTYGEPGELSSYKLFMLMRHF